MSSEQERVHQDSDLAPTAEGAPKVIKLGKNFKPMKVTKKKFGMVGGPSGLKQPFEMVQDVDVQNLGEEKLKANYHPVRSN